METESSLTHSKVSATSDPVRTPISHFLQIYLNIIFPSMPGSPKYSLSPHNFHRYHRLSGVSGCVTCGYQVFIGQCYMILPWMMCSMFTCTYLCIAPVRSVWGCRKVALVSVSLQRQAEICVWCHCSLPSTVCLYTQIEYTVNQIHCCVLTETNTPLQPFYCDIFHSMFRPLIRPSSG